MAHAPCSKESGFKCGKCRTTILIDNDGQMLLLDPANVENLELKGQQTEADATLWHLQTDGLPDWVTEAINQVNILDICLPIERENGRGFEI